MDQHLKKKNMKQIYPSQVQNWSFCLFIVHVHSNHNKHFCDCEFLLTGKKQYSKHYIDTASTLKMY